MVTGSFLVHLTASDAIGPWTARGLVTPPTTFNAHLVTSPAGEFIVYFRTNEMPWRNSSQRPCNGLSIGARNCT